MKFSRSIILASVFALGLSTAFGQGAGARGGSGGPGAQGGRQGGGFGMRGGGRLLLNEAVQKELKMNAAQIKKAQSTFGGQGGGPPVPGNRGGGAVGQGGTQGGGAQSGGGQMTDQQREQRRLDTEKLIKGILNANQFARFSQIALQLQGAGALTRKDVAAKVGLSAKQVDQIQKIQQSQMEAMRNAFQNAGGGQGGAQGSRGGAQGGGGNTDQRRQQFTKMREQTNSKILAVLSPAQKQKWQSLQGMPFKMPQGGGR